MAPRPPLEADEETAFTAWVNGLGLECLKLRIDGANGFPDRTVITPRGTLFFEFKRPGEALAPEQVIWKDRLERQGRAVFTVYSARDAVSQFLHWWRQNKKDMNYGGT